MVGSFTNCRSQSGGGTWRHDDRRQVRDKAAVNPPETM